MSIEKSKQRYFFLDLIKVIALVFMPCIHVFGLVCSFALNNDTFPIEALGVQFGLIYLIVPTVFSFSMGAALLLARDRSPKAFFKRGLRLLLTGFILNALRASIYLLFGIISDPVYFAEYWYWLWGSDILYFAGLFFLLFALFRKLKLNDWLIITVAIAMLAISQLVTPVSMENETLVQLVGNIVYVNYDSCFPLLSWTIYPVSGYLFMKGLMKTENRKKYVVRFGVSALAVLLISASAMLITDTFDVRYLLWGELDFIMDIPAVLLTLPIMAVYVCIMYFVAELIKSERVTAFFARVSSNLNSIYLIHWVIVMYIGFFWFVFASNLEIKSGWSVYASGFAVLIVSAVLAELFRRQKGKRKDTKLSQIR